MQINLMRLVTLAFAAYITEASLGVEQGHVRGSVNAAAIRKLNADIVDAKHMRKFSEIEDEQANAEEAAARRMEADAEHIASVAKADRNQKKRLDEEADARHLKVVAAREDIDAMTQADDAVRTWEDAAKLEAKADKDLESEKLATGVKPKTSLIVKGHLKASGNATIDKQDAVAIERLENSNREDITDAKHMQKFAEIEDEQANAEETAARGMEADAAHIADVAKSDHNQKKRLEEEADARHLKVVAAREDIDAMTQADDAVRTWEDAAKLQAKAESDLDEEKIDAASLEKAAAQEEQMKKTH